MRAKPKRMKESEKKNPIYLILTLVFLFGIIYSGYKIIIWHFENVKANEVLEEISKNVTVDDNNETKIDFKSIKEQYENVVGWLKVEGTAIDHPVVQTIDNDYYLNHNINKTENSAGWIFADCENKLDGTDKNMIIYGHNRRDGSMFSTLKDTLNSNWYNDANNRYVTFTTEQGETKYEVFSIYQVENEEYYLKKSFTAQTFIDFIKKIKQRSVKNFDTEVTENDSILTLSTCADNNNYRVVLHAKKIQ